MMTPEPGPLRPDGASALQYANYFLHKRGILGARCIGALVSGSQAYNLATASSDVDYKCVYFARTDDWLSLHPPEEHVVVVNGDLELADIGCYEVKEFAKLLSEGDPFAMEVLLTRRMCTLAQADWAPLYERRAELLTKVYVNRLLAFARGQMAVLQRTVQQAAKAGAAPSSAAAVESSAESAAGSDVSSTAALHRRATGKRLYHAIRLLAAALPLIDEGLEPDVFLAADCPLHAELTAVRADVLSPAQLTARVAELTAQLEQRRPWHRLPDAVDPAWLADWLVQLRLRHLDDAREQDGLARELID